MPTAKRPTIDDVASLAGVSRAAVSKVLRGAYGTSVDMKNRVQDAIAALGYRPQLAARAMRGRTFTIGVVLPDIRHGAAADQYAGIVERLSRTAYDVISAVGIGFDNNNRHLLDELVGRKADGLILLASHLPSELLAEVARDTPLVAVDRYERGKDFDTVNGDMRRSARLAVEHLAALGHERIAFVGRNGHDQQCGAVAQYAAAYTREMVRAGLQSSSRIFQRPETPTGAAALVDELLDYAATAVVASGDGICLELMSVLERRRKKVPRLMSLVGFGNSRVGAHDRLRLTSIDVPGRMVGSVAADLLLERLEGRRSRAHRLIQPGIFIRRSTAAPPVRVQRN